MQSLTEKFLFISRKQDEVSTLFSQKIIAFHELFVESLLLSDLVEPNEPIGSFNMQKNPEFSDVFFKNIVAEFELLEPLLISTLIHDEKIDSYLSIFYLPFEEIEGFYLLQQIEGWGGSGNKSYQVWSMKDDCNLYEMFNHWNFLV